MPVIYTAVPGAKLTSAAHKRGPSRLEGCGGGSRYYASSSDKQRPARQSSGRHRLGSGSLMCVLMVGRIQINVRTQLTYVRQEGMTHDDVKRNKTRSSIAKRCQNTFSCSVTVRTFCRCQSWRLRRLRRGVVACSMTLGYY